MSVHYAPCFECGEGTIEYDSDTGKGRCTACDAAIE